MPEPIKEYSSYVGPLKADKVLVVDIRAAGDVEMIRRSPSGMFWCRFDGVDPEPDAHNNFVVLRTRRFVTNKKIVRVKLISVTDLEISIEGSVF